jgi:hypothetical protein
MKTGKIWVDELPAPTLRLGSVLVSNVFTYQRRDGTNVG